mmetsp:Transcript_22960/g.45577  ORF Transcript_22960/g.45577 Transcript_22960/m.45577 type:complete len:222 (-) Transcript_22960:533-1198(-)
MGSKPSRLMTENWRFKLASSNMAQCGGAEVPNTGGKRSGWGSAATEASYTFRAWGGRAPRRAASAAAAFGLRGRFWGRNGLNFSAVQSSKGAEWVAPWPLSFRSMLRESTSAFLRVSAADASACAFTNRPRALSNNDDDADDAPAAAPPPPLLLPLPTPLPPLLLPLFPLPPMGGSEVVVAPPPPPTSTLPPAARIVVCSLETLASAAFKSADVRFKALSK